MPRRGGRRRRDEAIERSRRCRAVQAQIKRRRKLLHALNRALRHRGGAEALHSSDRYKGWKDTYLFSKFGSGPLHIHVKRNAISTRVCGASLVHVNCENRDFRVSWKEARLRLRARPSAPRSAPSLFVLNLRRCDRCTRTTHRLRTRNRSSLPRCFPSMVPRGHSCISGGSTLYVSLGLSHDRGFSHAGVAADQSASLLSTPCASLPRSSSLLFTG